MTKKPGVAVASGDPLIGYAEIAKLAGVKHQTAWEWKKRNLLPAPEPGTPQKRPRWRMSVMLRWLEATGRINTTTL